MSKVKGLKFFVVLDHRIKDTLNMMIGQLIDGDDYKALWQWKNEKWRKKKQNETIQLSYLNVNRIII